MRRLGTTARCNPNRLDLHASRWGWVGSRRVQRHAFDEDPQPDCNFVKLHDTVSQVCAFVAPLVALYLLRSVFLRRCICVRIPPVSPVSCLLSL
jgi:hypothetical protein